MVKPAWGKTLLPAIGIGELPQHGTTYVLPECRMAAVTMWDGERKSGPGHWARELVAERDPWKQRLNVLLNDILYCPIGLHL